MFGFSFKAKSPQRDPAAEPHSGWIFGGRKSAVTYSDALEARKAIAHPVAYRCLAKIAEAVSSVRWYAEADPDAPAVTRAGTRAVDAMNALLASPHDVLQSDQIRYWLAMNFALYGRVPFVVGVDAEGAPNALYPLAASLVTAELDVRGRISSYVYGTNERTRYAPRRSALPGRPYLYEIIRPTLGGDFTGYDSDASRPRALGAIGLPAGVVDLLLRRAYDTASGHPNSRLVISSSNQLTMAQRAEIQAFIRDSAPGGSESGSVLLLDGTTVKVDSLDNDLSDLHSKVPLDDMARMIAGAFGVPIPLLGLGGSDAAKFTGNYAEARRSFWEETIVPGYLSPIAVGLTAALCSPGMRIVFDLDSIEALADARIARAANLAKADWLAADEKRALLGFPPLTREQRAEIDAARSRAMTTPPTDFPTN